MKKADYYKKINNNTVNCRLCNHYCMIKDNSVGVCGARKNLNGELYSLVYGLPAAINIDPIEKKPLFHFQPGTVTYSLGTSGCNLKCANCQNWQLSQAGPESNLGIQEIPPEIIVKDAMEKKCPSISYTYNEPTVFAEYALEIMKLAKKNNLKNIWVSNGFMSADCLKAIIPYLDAINVDLKSMDEEFYLKYCGASLKPILNNLTSIKKAGIHLEITTLIIPGLSDDEIMLKDIAKFILRLGSDTPWHVTAFSPEISWKLKDLSPTSSVAINKAYDIGKKAGLKYVYAGNVYNSEKENTYCPNCSTLAIERLAYNIKRYDNNGLCKKCLAPLNIIG